jgi:hypothetical protein
MVFFSMPTFFSFSYGKAVREPSVIQTLFSFRQVRQVQQVRSPVSWIQFVGSVKQNIHVLSYSSSF